MHTIKIATLAHTHTPSMYHSMYIHYCQPINCVSETCRLSLIRFTSHTQPLSSHLLFGVGVDRLEDYECNYHQKEGKQLQL